MLTLLYHDILSAPADALPVARNQVTISAFRDQVVRLRKWLLHPNAVHESLARGRAPKGVLITFDDGGGRIVEAGKSLACLGPAGGAFGCPGGRVPGPGSDR